MAKKRTWKFWVGMPLLLIFIACTIFVVNLIWFKPFSVRLFYDKIFLEVALSNPELVTQLGIPVLYDMSKDKLTDVSDATQRAEFEHLKDNLETLKSYNFEGQSKENQLNTQILSWFLQS